MTYRMPIFFTGLAVAAAAPILLHGHAKSSLEGSLKEAGAKLKSGLEDLKSIGKADPAQIIIALNVECLPK